MRAELLLILGALVISGDCGRRPIGDSVIHELSRRRNGSLPKMSIGLVVPHTNFGVREYTKAVNRTVGSLRRSYGRTKGQSKYSFLDKYNFTQKLSMMTLTPSPTGTTYESMRAIPRMMRCFFILAFLLCHFSVKFQFLLRVLPLITPRCAQDSL